MNGYFRVAAGIPMIKVADVRYNAAQIIEIIGRAKEKGVRALVFPELCLTGATCGDLFLQAALQKAVSDALPAVIKASEGMDMVIVGAPVVQYGRLYNCAVFLSQGKCKWAKIKTRLTHAEKSVFSDALSANGQAASFGDEFLVLFDDHPNALSFEGIESAMSIDWFVGQADPDAGIVFNLDAAPETAASKDARKRRLSAFSEKTRGAVIYADAGYGESTTDFVFAGHGLIYENGGLLAETERFSLDSQLIYCDIDVEKILCDRQLCGMKASEYGWPITRCNKSGFSMLERKIPENPFLPESEAQRDETCEEILNIQVFGLIKRMAHLNMKKMILGVSGGLDSTLALLVCLFAKRKMDESPKDILAITMPGYGTSSKTYQNAVRLIRLLGAEFREISIAAACDLHFKEIGHDKTRDTAYENAQARERTQLLFDIANMENGVVVGTGDFTELALGFATYNGDHMSNYSVNANVPKTVIKAVIRWLRKQYFSDADTEGIGAILDDIIDTPISPELLPPDKTGAITQKTEEIIGDYALNDFFLYYVMKYGFSPGKIIQMAAHAFQGRYAREELIKRLESFYRRFITQQFKRSCMPDGPSVYDFGFSPRKGYQCPSDASFEVWLQALSQL